MPIRRWRDIFRMESEAARCVFDYARGVLRVSRVVSLIHPDNVRSLRIAQRFGAQCEDVVEVLSHLYGRFVWPVTVRQQVAKDSSTVPTDITQPGGPPR